MSKLFLFAIAVVMSFLTAPAALAQYEESSPEDFWESSYEDESYIEGDEYYHSQVEVVDDPWSIDEEIEYEASQDGYYEDEETYYEEEVEEVPLEETSQDWL